MKCGSNDCDCDDCVSDATGTTDTDAIAITIGTCTNYSPKT